MSDVECGMWNVGSSMVDAMSEFLIWNAKHLNFEHLVFEP